MLRPARSVKSRSCSCMPSCRMSPARIPSGNRQKTKTKIFGESPVHLPEKTILIYPHKSSNNNLMHAASEDRSKKYRVFVQKQSQKPYKGCGYKESCTRFRGKPCSHDVIRFFLIGSSVGELLKGHQVNGSKCVSARQSNRSGRQIFRNKQ